MSDRILITRPEPEASELAKLMQPRTAVVFPLLAIQTLTAVKLHAEGTLIFVSKNAARFYQGPILPAFALGLGTAKQLSEKGFQDVTTPKADAGSEAFLNLPELQNVKGQRFIIVRGTEGRDLIETNLKQRGASVDNHVVYETTQSKNLDCHLLQHEYSLLIVTSTHALRYLAELLQTHNPSLFKVPVTILTGNMLKSALELGFNNPQIVESFNNEYLRHFKPNPHPR